MMGFNCAQSYVFWNATEPKKGVFDFSDSLDLDAWLSPASGNGDVRAGPARTLRMRGVGRRRLPLMVERQFRNDSAGDGPLGALL